MRGGPRRTVVPGACPAATSRHRGTTDLEGS